MRRSRHAPRHVLLAVLLTLPLVFSGFPGLSSPSGTNADALSDALARQAALQRQISAQKAALAALKASEAKLTAALGTTADRLDAINTDQASVKAQIGVASQALQVVQGHYDELVAELAHLDWTLGLLDDELAQGQADLALRKGLLAQHLADAYKLQRTSLLEQILASDSLTGVLAKVGTYLRVGDEDAALAQEIEQQRADLAVLHRTTDATRSRTEQLRAEVAAELATLQQQKAALDAAQKKLGALEARTLALQQQQTVAFQKVAGSKAAAAALLAKELADEAKLQAQVNALVAAQIAKGGIPAQYKGSLIWPMTGFISQPFGCTGFIWEPPLGNCAHFHPGIDIVRAAGTPVRASGPGVVILAGYSPWGDGAWLVIIAHSSHLVSWYAHLQAHNPAGIYKGAVVVQGQLIGNEGCTGICTGPHLHWAVQLDRNWINPRLFLP